MINVVVTKLAKPAESSDILVECQVFFTMKIGFRNIQGCSTSLGEGGGNLIQENVRILHEP